MPLFFFFCFVFSSVGMNAATKTIRRVQTTTHYRYYFSLKENFQCGEIYAACCCSRCSWAPIQTLTIIQIAHWMHIKCGECYFIASPVSTRLCVRMQSLRLLIKINFCYNDMIEAPNAKYQLDKKNAVPAKQFCNCVLFQFSIVVYWLFCFIWKSTCRCYKS